MTTTPDQVLPDHVLLVVGPAQHGVTAAALVQAAVPGPVEVVRCERPVGPDDVAGLTAAVRGRLVHVHVTDRLFGRSPEEAAEFVVALAGSCTLVVTLHDLPQPSDGTVNHPRRSAAYARIARAAAGVVVSSEHERRLLHACGVEGPGPVVVPLPVPSPGVDLGERDAASAGDVAVLGFLYPGKGHEAVLEALVDLPAAVGLRALGRPSEGHEDLPERLSARAAQLGRRFTVSGFVPEPDLPRSLRSVLVPVAPHEHLSASGSINTWIGAGRRPLVPVSDYAEELLTRNPGAVELYDDLPDALSRAVADPGRTWLPSGFRGHPTVEEAVVAVRTAIAGAVR